MQQLKNDRKFHCVSHLYISADIKTDEKEQVYESTDSNNKCYLVLRRFLVHRGPAG